MQQLCNFQDVAEAFLQTLGDGNWNFGGAAPANARSYGDPDAPLLEKYLGDLLAVLLASLDSRSRALKAKAGSTPSNAGIGPIFFLNNIAYVRREILSSSIGDVLGAPAEDDLNKRNRAAKAQYLELFSGLIACLMDAGMDQGLLKTVVGGSASQGGITKDRFQRFNDALVDVESMHRVARLDAGEEEMRERLEGEISKMILPTYSKFAGRNRGGLEVEAVESRLVSLFR